MINYKQIVEKTARAFDWRLVHLFAQFIHQLPVADEQQDKKPAAAPLSR